MWQDAMLDFCNETLVPRFRSFSLFFPFLELRLSHMKGMRMPGQKITLQQWLKLYLTPERNHTETDNQISD